MVSMVPTRPQVNGIKAECATNRDVFGPNYDKTFDPYYAIDKATERECNGDPTKGNCSFAYSSPDCSFVYDPSFTPVISKVTTSQANNEANAGDEIVIHGTGFLGSPTVQVGGAPCAVEFENDTLVKCTVTHMKAGKYHPVLVSSEVGQAEIANNVKRIVYQIVIKEIAPTRGSVRGGDMLLINGTGFSDIVHENHVIVGGGKCYPKQTGFEYILCHLPFSHLIPDLDTRCWGGEACAVSTKTSANGTNSANESGARAVKITQTGTGFSWQMSALPSSVVGKRLNDQDSAFYGYQKLTVYENDVVTFAGTPGSKHNFAVKLKDGSGKDVVGPTTLGEPFDGLKWTPVGLGGQQFKYYCGTYTRCNATLHLFVQRGWSHARVLVGVWVWLGSANG